MIRDKAVVVQRQVPHGADAAQGQQSQSIDEIIDTTVSVQRQNPSKSKRPQQTTEIPQSQDPEDRGDSIQKIVEIHPEDHGGSRLADSEGRGGFQFRYTVKVVDDTAES